MKRSHQQMIGLDEYAIRKKIIESKITKPKANTSKSITSETIDDEDDVSEVNTVSPVKTNEIQTVKTQADKIGQTSQKEGIRFKKIKACFVCKSTDHLIKDCDFYAKKSLEPKLKTMVNTGQRVVKPVWDNAKRENHQKFSNKLKYPQTRTFVPSGVLTRTGLINPVRPNRERAVHNVSTARPRSYYTRPVVRHKDLKQNVKTSGVKNMTTAGTRAVVNTGKGNPDICLQDHAVVDSGCSSHMTGNKAYLSDYEDYNGGFVAFGSDPKGGKITGKGKIRTANLDFDDVYFVDELKFNLFSVSQMCDKKNSVLFTDTECLILSPSFKLLDESQVVLRAPRQNDVYSLDLKNIVPSGGITCLYANATSDESKLWHRRLGHVNFKNINKLVKGHLVRGLPSKVFVNDHTCVACKKGKQHKASCKAKLERTIRKPLELLHMDLFGPVSVESINKKKYCLVVTDDFSRFSWVFFLATKDETNEILYKFITGLENQLNHKVKIIRSDHGTEFKNHAMNELCAKKGIKREFSVARTPQQNGKFDGKSDEGYLLGYSTSSSSGKDKGPTQEYILLLLQPHRIRIPVEDVPSAAHEKLSESSSKDNDVPDSEDTANKESEQNLQDELEIMVTQELAAKAMDDVSRQAFKEEKRRIASQKKAAQAIQLYQNIVRYAILLVLIGPQLVLISALLLILDGLTPPMCLVLASTPTGANAHESSFFYLGGKIPIDASTLPNADLPIDPNMPDLEDASDTLPNDGIFNGAYRENHKINPKGQSFRDPTSAVQKQEGRFKKLSPAQITQALVKEPNTISQALQDESWVEAIARRIASFKLTEGGYLLIFPYWEKGTNEEGSVKQQPDGIFVSQDKYVVDILKKFDFWSMISSLMYLTASRPDIMFVVCACARFQVTLKASHLNAVKRNFRGYVGDFVPLLPAMLAGAVMDQGDRSAQPAEPYHTPVDPLPSTSQPPIQSPPYSPLQSPPHSPLQSPPYSPSHYSPPRSYEAPLPEGNTSGSAEASIQLKELIVLVPNLVTRVTSLEKELKETKQILGNVVLKLVKKVKSLEITLKRKSKKVIMSALEGEEPEDRRRIIQDIDDDPLVSLINTGRVEINTGIEDVNTDRTKVDTGRTSISTSSIILSPKKGQREGKAQMVEEDIQTTYKTKEQIRQEEVGLEEAIRLQAQMDEEVAKQIHLDKIIAKRVQEEQELSEQQLKRKAKVQKAAQFYTKEDWDTIRAKLEANTEVLKSLQGESIRNDDFEKRMVEMINEKKKFYAEQKAKAKRMPIRKPEAKSEKTNGLQLEQETSKKQKIDIEDDSITKGKDEVVKEREAEVPVKKTGKRRKQKARKGKTIAKLSTRDLTMKDKHLERKSKMLHQNQQIGV
ncbi:putative ribonuclease H-like domain-containing protein [Tanacetum coccineum]